MNKVFRASFCKASAGTVMVELAIILPLLLFLLFGITELGRALYQQNMLTQAVESGGRYMARIDGAVDVDEDNGDCSEGDNWESAVAGAKNLIKCGIDGIAGCADNPNISFDAPNYFEVCGPGSPHDSCPSTTACVITVKATVPFQSIFGGDNASVLGSLLDGVQLNAATQERYIGL